ncbi:MULTISPECIES: segregation and condensation protein A [unclassified Streptomyces]|uniref:segregation and condensation protein A n=1 Tax=unclassified Streptomyces TaxID=2593676 RepID=UPI00382B65AF
MTSPDAPDATTAPAPAPGPSGGRRRALGRGPGTGGKSGPAAPEPPAEPTDPPSPGPDPGAVETPAADAVEPPGPDETAPASVIPSDRGAFPETAETGPRPGPDPQEPGDGNPGPGGTGAPADPGAASDGPQPAAAPEPAPGTPDGVFKVRLANFEGPFDLLLQLISKHKLDVTEVALSKVTDEFMAHIRAMGPDWDLDQTTEFLVVAATLLDLKAARLLPAAEVEDEADLALLEARDLLFARLLQYRAYKQIADILNARLDEEARRYPRTVGLEAHHAELLPEVVISIGAEGFARLAVKAMQPRAKPQVYVEHIHAPLVSVQEQAGIVVARLRLLGEASFRVLVDDTDDTLTVVARFLALLELYREKAVALDQETALGDLLVRWTGGDGEGRPRVTDEFDRPPEDPEKPEKPEKTAKSQRAERKP